MSSSICYAPICLPAYKRLSHIKNAIRSLQKCELSDMTRLYVFSDGPQPGDEDAVHNVRAYLKTITGFLEVIVIEREENQFLKNSDGTTNGMLGIAFLLKKYGKVIVVEEDLVVSPCFLSFMNYCLDFYKDDSRVFSVTGYSLPLRHKLDQKTLYLLPRFCGWGSGLWLEKWRVPNKKITIRDLMHLLRPLNIIHFLRGGVDLIPTFIADLLGLVRAGDARMNFMLVRKKMYTLYPAVSYVSNKGFDGSGAHCKQSDRYDVTLYASDCMTYDAAIKASKKHVQFSLQVFAMRGLIQQFLRLIERGFRS